MMVTPAWPPTTGQFTLVGSMFFRAPMKALLLTTSRVETPNTLLGSRVPALEKISQAMGTVELTGLEMMAIMALGQTLAAAVQISATMLALVVENCLARVDTGAWILENIVSGIRRERCLKWP